MGRKPRDTVGMKPSAIAVGSAEGSGEGASQVGERQRKARQLGVFRTPGASAERLGRMVRGKQGTRLPVARAGPESWLPGLALFLWALLAPEAFEQRPGNARAVYDFQGR